MVATACATTSSTGPSPRSQPRASRADLVVAIGEQNVRVGTKTFTIGDADAIRAGVAGACANECDRVEIHAIPTARFDVLSVSYAAAVDHGASAVVLRIAASAPAQMVVGAEGEPGAACSAEVVLRDASIDVYVAGVAAPPDNHCATWGASICGTDPERLGDLAKSNRANFRNACIFAHPDAAASTVERTIAAVQRGVPNARFSLRRDRRQATLNEREVQEALVAQSATLTQCYNTALETSRVPMRLVARVLLNPDGRVVRFEARDTQQTTPEFEQCVAEALRAMQFPKPTYGGHFEMNYPLSFTPR